MNGSSSNGDVEISPHSSTPPQEIPSLNGSSSREYLDPYDGMGALGTSPSRTTSGKSGRVIEKLMAENDRLRRELKVETTAREEERKAKEAIRQSRDSLQSTNDNLILQNNIDKSSLQRKDRKIEELKADLDFEKEQRLELDERTRIQGKEADVQVQELKNALSRANEERKLAVNQYETCREGFRRLDDSYRQRVERIKSQLDVVQAERERDHAFLQRLEVTVEQQRQELEKLRLAKNGILEKCESVLDKAEADMGYIRKMAGTQEEVLEKTVVDAKEALHALRHLIGIEKAFRGTPAAE
jgi:chromosome segregation ATPase